MKLKPQKKYRAPDYPTQELYINKPHLMKENTPAIWKANKTVAGALLAFVMAGQTQAQSGQPDQDKTSVLTKSDNQSNASSDQQVEKQNREEQVKIAPIFYHGDGIGATGCIAMSPPVFMTEEEAQRVILDEFNKIGIDFILAEYEISDLLLEVRERETSLDGDDYKVIDHKPMVFDLYNPDLNLGVEFVTVRDFDTFNPELYAATASSFSPLETAEYFRENLLEYNKVNAAIFYDPLTPLDFSIEMKYCENGKTDWDAIDAEHRKKSEEQIRKQVQDFIKWMKSEGLVPKSESKD